MLVRRLRRRGGDGGKQREEVVPPKGGGFGSGTRARSSRPSVALAHRTCTHGSQLQAGQCGSGCPAALLWPTYQQKCRLFSRAPPGKIFFAARRLISARRRRGNFSGRRQTAGFVRRLGRCVRAPGMILAGQCLQLRLLEQLAASRASLATTLVCSAPTCRRQTVSVERAYGTVRNRFTGERGT